MDWLIRLGGPILRACSSRDAGCESEREVILPKGQNRKCKQHPPKRARSVGRLKEQELLPSLPSGTSWRFAHCNAFAYGVIIEPQRR